jgi:hypothetical protein
MAMRVMHSFTAKVLMMLHRMFSSLRGIQAMWDLHPIHQEDGTRGYAARWYKPAFTTDLKAGVRTERQPHT